MAKQKGSRARSTTGRSTGSRVHRVRRPASSGKRVESSPVSSLLIGAVKGAQVVAESLAEFTRSAASETAKLGVEAFGAIVSAARGIVGAASRMVGNVAEAVQNGAPAPAIGGRNLPGRGARRPASRRALTPTVDPTSEASETPSAGVGGAGVAKRARRSRAVRQQRAGAAA